MYYDGCNAETTLQDLPVYIQTDGKLVVNEDTECEKILLKNWNTIVSYASCYEPIFDDFVLSDYPYLEIFEVSPPESFAFGRSDTNSLTFES